MFRKTMSIVTRRAQCSLRHLNLANFHQFRKATSKSHQNVHWYCSLWLENLRFILKTFLTTNFRIFHPRPYFLTYSFGPFDCFLRFHYLVDGWGLPYSFLSNKLLLTPPINETHSQETLSDTHEDLNNLITLCQPIKSLNLILWQ